MVRTPLMIDDDKILSYEELLKSVNEAKNYKAEFRTSLLSDFLINFVKALAFNKNIAAIDGGLNEAEAKNLGLENLDADFGIDARKAFSNLEELIESLRKSESKITIFTSGTTGLPKRVVHSVPTLARQTRASANYRNNVWGFAYNPSHMAGLQVLLQILFNQNSAVNLFRKSKPQIYEAIDKFKITNISATPTFYRLLLPENKIHPSVFRITIGGEKSQKPLYENLLKAFPNAKINNVYASTEGASLLASNGEFFTIPERLSALLIVRDNELLIHKSLLGESGALALDNDFYHTGDIVEFKDETHFKFLARTGNLVNVGGYKVNTEEVEDALRSMDQVAEAVVYGKKNSVLGNILCADIKLKENGQLETADIRNFLAGKLQNFKIPRVINFIDKINTTSTGKMKRQ